MKILFTSVLLLQLTFSFAQWTKVQTLPSTDIFSLYRKDTVLYAGGQDIVYFSKDKGQTWDSTSTIPQFTLIDNIIVYKDELYVCSFRKGVAKSADNGVTWQNITAGIIPFVSGFAELNGDLYAGTLGDAFYKLNPATHNSWLRFSTGISNQGANINAVASTSTTLVGGTLGNAMYEFLPANSAVWQERFILGQLRPSEGIHNIIPAHDSLFMATTVGAFYFSTNGGFTWTKFGNTLATNFTSLVNAREAVLAARNVFNGVDFNSTFFFIKKDALQNNLANFSSVLHQFTYKMEIFGNKLWAATNVGLFFMSLKDLPGITDPHDSLPALILPVKYISFTARITSQKTVQLQWKTSDEVNFDHFVVERSADGITWNSLGNVLPAATHEYSYTDMAPLTGNNFYRIKNVDVDNKFGYTEVKRVTIQIDNRFIFWPNPAKDELNVQLPFTKGFLEIADMSGRIVLKQNIYTNNIAIPVNKFEAGIYMLRAVSDNQIVTGRFIKK